MKMIKNAGILLLIASLLYVGFGVYSMSWSARLLQPVTQGMSQTEVRSLIGSPVTEIHRKNGTSAWDYNKWFWTDAVVYFDTAGLVTAVETD